MPVHVLKFGGTSVESPAHIIAVARRVLALRASGDPIVVVVSAMGQQTDELIRLAHRVARAPSRRELDMLLTAGERISMTLLAMCLESMGCPAISFTGSQSGIITDSRHSDARILELRGDRIQAELDRGRVVIVAGFQGVSRDKEVTTLGRGGSDTTAVALAIRLRAPAASIFTDVEGVLSADPRVVPEARRIPEVGYEAMIVLSHLGGRVLFRRAIILARKYGMPVEVRHATSPAPGTRIPPRPASLTHPEPGGPNLNDKNASSHHGRPGSEMMETARVLAVALESPVHWIRAVLPATTPHPGGIPTEAAAFPRQGSPLLLLCSRTRLPDGRRLVDVAASPDPELEPWLDASGWGPGTLLEVEREAACVSIVGEGVLAEGAMLRRVESVLADAGIEILAAQTGILSLSCLVRADQGDAASRALHHALITEATSA